MAAGPKPIWVHILFVTMLSGGILAAFSGLGWLVKPTPPPDQFISYRDIQCNAPPGQTLAEFLDELRYIGLPEKIDTADQNVERDIVAVFRQHPRVGEARRVEGVGLKIEVEFKKVN